VPGRRRPSNRYELFTCAWSGHVLVGTDAATVTPDDALVVRADGPLRWHRCLRCDCWVALAPPDRVVVPLNERPYGIYDGFGRHCEQSSAHYRGQDGRVYPCN